MQSINNSWQGRAAWQPSAQSELDHHFCKRFVERKAADDAELCIGRAAELRLSSKPGPMPDRLSHALPILTREDYERVIRRNLHQMSRTAMGIVDVSATKDKAASMATLSGEQARLATEASLSRAINWMYQNRFTVFSTATQLRAFIETLARIITDGVLKPDHLIRRHDSTKYPYTLVGHLENAMVQFSVELHARMATGESPRTLAPWVEYRIDLSDHFFADGCGKTSQLMAAFVCMRAEHPPALYRSREEYYALNGTTRRGVDKKADELTLRRFTAYYQQLFMPYDIFRSVAPDRVNDALRLLKQRDFRPKTIDDSGNTYNLRRQLLAKGPSELRNATESHLAYTYPFSDSQDLPMASSSKKSKMLTKAYISDSGNWVLERRRLHEQVYEELCRAAIELHESIGDFQKNNAKPLLLMMRGNSGAGKTYFLNNLARDQLPHLDLPNIQDIASGVINPDTFKACLRSKLPPDELKWSQQIHAESSMLAGRLITEMRDSGRNLIVDKRLGTISDVAGITGPKGATGHCTIMIDIDAPLELSLKVCEERDDQSASVRPTRKAIVDGFRLTRLERRSVSVSPLLDAYYAYGRVQNDQGIWETVAVARRDQGESNVTPMENQKRLWRELTLSGAKL